MLSKPTSPMTSPSMNLNSPAMNSTSTKSNSTSVTQWLVKLRHGDEVAAQQIWDCFFGRLVFHAKYKMYGMGTAVTDEEDIALSVLRSFCFGLQNGRFRDLQNRNSLWRMLAVICGRKISNQRTFQHRLKRNISKQASINDENQLINLLISQEPTPDLAAEMAEDLLVLIETLEQPNLKSVAIAKMQGHSNREIAESHSCSLATVERRLKTIRSIWEQNIDESV